MNATKSKKVKENKQSVTFLFRLYGGRERPIHNRVFPLAAIYGCQTHACRPFSRAWCAYFWFTRNACAPTWSECGHHLGGRWINISVQATTWCNLFASSSLIWCQAVGEPKQNIARSCRQITFLDGRRWQQRKHRCIYCIYTTDCRTQSDDFEFCRCSMLVFENVFQTTFFPFEKEKPKQR